MPGVAGKYSDSLQLEHIRTLFLQVTLSIVLTRQYYYVYTSKKEFTFDAKERLAV